MCPPKYTVINGINKSGRKGWSLDGKIRYIELVEEVEKWRNSKASKMKEIGEYVINECRKTNGSSKRKMDNNKKHNREESEKEKKWREFLKRSTMAKTVESTGRKRVRDGEDSNK